MDSRKSELCRLFIVCGRNCKEDELRALFSPCGAIKHLHLVLDRSKKSRGFAFLQYENSSNAVKAIEKLDHLELQDGHILKVTAAKERPAGGNGKQKRDQHAQQGLDEKAKEKIQEDEKSIDARLHGKRQRSSPPIYSLSRKPRRVVPSFVLENGQLDEYGCDNATLTRLKMKSSDDEVPLPNIMTKSNFPDVCQTNVAIVMHMMISAIEQIETHKVASSKSFFTYKRVSTSLSDVYAQMHDARISAPKESIKKETSAHSLASSIRSVSLAPASITNQGSQFESPDTTLVQASKDVERKDGIFSSHLRRRRDNSIDSGSSLEDGMGGGRVRRKRSNRTQLPNPTIKDQICASLHMLSPPKNISMTKRNGPIRISMPLVDIKAENTPKLVCKLQSSDNAIKESNRLQKQQGTQGKSLCDGRPEDAEFSRRSAANKSKLCKNVQDIKGEFRSDAVKSKRTKLFFTSTYKLTQQEVEAIFGAYGDLESAKLVKTFGRIKTMAYICYSKLLGARVSLKCDVKPCTAAFVVKSFREESCQGNADLERSESMTLSFAHVIDDLHIRQRRKVLPVKKELDCLSNASFSSSLANSAAPSAMLSNENGRLWVLLLYDRFLATHMLSSVVSSFQGMEFVDIKVIKSSGEAQGVAFVKFNSEANAENAAIQLHHMELPLGSGKFMQATVVLAPSQFSATHGNISSSSDESMRIDFPTDKCIVTGSSEDLDLRAVEAQFAHLMRSSKHTQAREGHYSRYCTSTPFQKRKTPSLPIMVRLAHPSGYHAPMSMEYHTMSSTAYPPPYPPLPPPFLTNANYWPGNYHHFSHPDNFGRHISGWMDVASYYQGRNSFHRSSKQGGKKTSASLSVCNKSRCERSSSMELDVEESKSSCGNRTSVVIHISTSERLELAMLLSALQHFSGIESLAKDGTGHVVNFTNEVQALEALRKLDGTLCGGQRLRVVRITSSRHRGAGGGKPRTGSSGRRKRQRIDLRSRK
ncbi:hypothetical protein CCR75_005772 [Bremia lactucae]|uniref:RRM domain-containing protein n=1 Tax=Bremia lactucae TaxID=4779 RepID=A0A976FP25_BRELC|nr:hypothetical protein CCR75_005772 [Bremia lactucae]